MACDNCDILKVENGKLRSKTVELQLEIGELVEDLETTAQLNVLLLEYAPQDMQDGVREIIKSKMEEE